MSLQNLTSNMQLLTQQNNMGILTRTIESTHFLTASLDENFSFEGDERKFHAYFLIKGEEINGNKWGVPDESIPKNIQTFEGMPFLVTADAFIEDSPYKYRYLHPNINHFKNYKPELVQGLDAENLDDVLKFQNQWKVGDIRRVLYDSSDDYWKALVEPLPLYEDNKFPPFCSPSIFKKFIFENDKKIMFWQGVHLAGLMDKPAYGSQAIYEGSCSGTLGSCTKFFSDTKSIWETQLKFSQNKIAALMSTDNPVVNKVPVEGDCNDGGFSKYSTPCQNKK